MARILRGEFSEPVFLSVYFCIFSNGLGVYFLGVQGLSFYRACSLQA